MKSRAIGYSILGVSVAVTVFIAGFNTGKLKMYETKIQIPPAGTELTVCMRSLPME